jgi:hypothetical protein
MARTKSAAGLPAGNEHSVAPPVLAYADDVQRHRDDDHCAVLRGWLSESCDYHSFGQAEHGVAVKGPAPCAGRASFRPGLPTKRRWRIGADLRQLPSHATRRSRGYPLERIIARAECHRKPDRYAAAQDDHHEQTSAVCSSRRLGRHGASRARSAMLAAAATAASGRQGVEAPDANGCSRDAAWLVHNRLPCRSERAQMRTSMLI